jgi:hypothetical protein
MMEINSCCGRWTLRTGSIVIGVLDLVIFEFDFCIQLFINSQIFLILQIYMVALIVWMLVAEDYWREILNDLYGQSNFLYNYDVT